MDTKFSVALHILIYISETEKTPSSENLAQSVNTNASHIRKITLLLKQAGLIASQQGKSGFYLVKEPADVSLKEVYQAVYPEKTLLHVHEDANPNCPVGSRIEQVLSPVFEDAEASLLNRLNQENLSDLITDMYKIN